MYDFVCACGHAYRRHRVGSGGCQESGCECRGLFQEPLPGVYHLDSVRNLLKRRSGRSLLEQRPARPPAPRRSPQPTG
jgi:hypothetical protein